MLIDIETDEIVADGLSMPHSPRVRGVAIYIVESGRGALVRIDRASGRREDVAFCPGFARGLAFVDHYAVLTISLPRSVAFDGLPVADAMRKRGATPWRGLIIVDLRNGDIVQWLRLEGDVTELFDVGVVARGEVSKVGEAISFAGDRFQATRRLSVASVGRYLPS